MGLSNPLVTIITVVYNGKNTIENAIRSVVNQSYDNIEYIVIDGGSKDGTVDVIKQYEKNISFWSTEPDKGIYDAMNKGIQRAHGELIGILNCDDWFEPDCVKDVVNVYLQNPGYEVFHGLLRLIDSQSKEAVSVVGHRVSFLKEGMIEHPTCFVTRNAYKKFGLFDISYSYAADYEFMLRLKENGALFYFIEKVLASFLSGGGSTSLKAANETIRIRYRYKLISVYKMVLLKLYWNIKLLSI